MLTGYCCITHTPRPFSSACGGVAVYVRTHLAPFAQHVVSYADLGISMIRLALPSHDPVFLICCYLPHEHSQTWAESDQPNRAEARTLWYESLQLCVERAADGAVVVCGDFNSRTGLLSESQDDDWAALAELGLPVPETVTAYSAALDRIPSRSNCDTRTNTWGRALVDFTREARFVIANGRLPGDTSGEYTFVTQNGCSSIDYFLVPPYLCFQPDGTPSVGAQLEVLSHRRLPNKPSLTGADARFDHAPVSLTFAVPRTRPRSSQRGQRCRAFKWDASRQQAYADTLSQDPTVQVLLGRVLGVPDGSSQRAAQLLTCAVSHAASLCFREVKFTRSQTTHHRSKPWYDALCVHLGALRESAVDIHGADSPQARAATSNYWFQIRAARRAYQEAEMAKMVALWEKNSQLFWKSFQSDKSAATDIFTLDDWTRYFEGLYARMGEHSFTGGSVGSHVAAHTSIFPEPSETDKASASHLNRQFSQDDVFRAVKVLQNGKAAGTDGLPAELLKKAFEPDPRNPNMFTDPHLLLPDITRVMNLVFTGAYPHEWSVSALTAIPKAKGDPNNMDDYRGIAVGNALARLYSTLLMQRMDDWAETHERRAKGQAGFRRARSTVDNIIVLQHAIERARSCKKVVYCAFIDFQKAYDSVNRDLLWQALQGLGVHGTFLRSLQCLYANVGMRVKLAGGLGRMFAAPLGVRQGDPLSPLLFGLYIDRFEQFVLQECPRLGIELTDTQIVSLLLYADDLVLMSHSPEDLQALLDVLHRFALANHLTVNTQKSKVLACGAPNWRGQVRYGGHALPTIDSFVYLGVRFFSCHNKRGNARLNMQSNLTKAKQALGALRSRCRELGIHNVAVLTRLFDSLVRSVLDYGCEFWGVYQLHDVGSKSWGENHVCEQMQRSFVRYCFGVRSQTPVAVMMNEARRQPLVRSWCQRAVRWWNKVVARDDDDLAFIAVRDSLTSVSDSVAGKPARCWAVAFRNMIQSIAPHYTELVDSLELIPVEAVLSAFDEQGSTQAWGDWRSLASDAQPLRHIPPANSSGFKLATYRHLFCTDTVEKKCGFADHVHTPAQIKALASFRMSSHDLNIERLRHTRRPRNERLCECCDQQCVEDELHVFECPAYAHIRASFADLIPVPTPPCPEAYMRAFMNPTQPTQWPRLADFLIRVMTERTRILTVRNEFPIQLF